MLKCFLVSVSGLVSVRCVFCSLVAVAFSGSQAIIVAAGFLLESTVVGQQVTERNGDELGGRLRGSLERARSRAGVCTKRQSPGKWR